MGWVAVTTSAWKMVMVKWTNATATASLGGCIAKWRISHRFFTITVSIRLRGCVAMNSLHTYYGDSPDTFEESVGDGDDFGVRNGNGVVAFPNGPKRKEHIISIFCKPLPTLRYSQRITTHSFRV
jgi:hypothetical protein